MMPCSIQSEATLEVGRYIPERPEYSALSTVATIGLTCLETKPVLEAVGEGK